MARNSNGLPPTYIQAGIYTEVAFYLKAIQAAGTDNADKVVAQMRTMKINDFMTKNGWLREDGRVMRDMYLEEVKSPAESKYPFDYVKILTTIPAEEAFRPLKERRMPACTWLRNIGDLCGSCGNSNNQSSTRNRLLSERAARDRPFEHLDPHRIHIPPTR